MDEIGYCPRPVGQFVRAVRVPSRTSNRERGAAPGRRSSARRQPQRRASAIASWVRATACRPRARAISPSALVLGRARVRLWSMASVAAAIASSKAPRARCELGPGLGQTQPPQPLVPTRGARRGRGSSPRAAVSAGPGSWLRAQASNASMFALTIGGANPTVLARSRASDLRALPRRGNRRRSGAAPPPWRSREPASGAPLYLRPQLSRVVEGRPWPRRSVPPRSGSARDARAST